MAEVDPDYTPTVSAEQIERIRHWHEDAYTRRQSEMPAVRTFDYLGLTLTVPPEVQPIASVSHLLGEAVLAEVTPDDRVLDMGQTGWKYVTVMCSATCSAIRAATVFSDTRQPSSRRSSVIRGDP